MSLVISNTGLTLPTLPAPVSGQIFYQIGSGPKIFNGTIWVALDQTAVEFLSLLSENQNTTAIVTALTDLTTALNTNSANLVAATNSIATFTKALAIIDEYWHQLHQVSVDHFTKGAISVAVNEPLIGDHPIVDAHNTAQTTIQS